MRLISGETLFRSIVYLAVPLFVAGGCTLTAKEGDSQSKADLEHLPANRYAGLSCDAILDSIARELKIGEYRTDTVSNERPQNPNAAGVDHGAWTARCEWFDYRSVLMDTKEIKCPTEGVSVDSCKYHVSRIYVSGVEEPGKPTRYSGVYDMKCQYDFADGTKFQDSSRFGLVSPKDCP